LVLALEERYRVGWNQTTSATQLPIQTGCCFSDSSAHTRLYMGSGVPSLLAILSVSTPHPVRKRGLGVDEAPRPCNRGARAVVPGVPFGT
jgi:hypothetical protein